MFSFHGMQPKWKLVVEPSPNIAAVTSSVASLATSSVVSSVTSPEETTQAVLVQAAAAEQRVSESQTRPAESSGPLGYEAKPQTSTDNLAVLQADEAKSQTPKDNLSRVDKAKVQTSNGALNELFEHYRRTSDGDHKVAGKVADIKQARTGSAPRATRVTRKATTAKATKESVQPPKENLRAKPSESKSKSAGKRKRPAANKAKTRKRARGPFDRRRKVTESSSEDDDDGVEVQRTRDDAFEIRFNHLYKPDAKLPDSCYDFGKYEGKFVSEVVVCDQEVWNGTQNWGFCGIAYLRWMLSDKFKPRRGQYKLLKAVRAHSKAYDRFMNSVQPSTVP
jgi:hypothetical protein